MKKPEKLIALLMSAVMLFGTAALLTGCGSEEPAAGDKTHVVLNEVAHSIFYAPMYVAIEEGYFAEGEVREEQRNLAFILTFAGYLTALIFSVAGNCGRQLQYIIISYFISMSLLVFFNKVLHVRASGHACSVTGTLYFLSFFLGAAAIIPCVCIAAAVVWSSLRLKRHTIQEIFWGSAVCLPCILASVFIL